MNKKILVGSIIAVAILVLVSFTSVVGYGSVKSNSVKESPLFKVRSNRAIDEESQELTCNYVSKGNFLPFPKKDDKAIMIQNVVDTIRKMDDKTFERFIAYIINNRNKDKSLNGENPDEIRESFNLVRNSNEPIPIFDAETHRKHLSRYTCYCTFGCTLFGGLKGLLECLKLDLLYLIVSFFSLLMTIFRQCP